MEFIAADQMLIVTEAPRAASKRFELHTTRELVKLYRSTAEGTDRQELAEALSDRDRYVVGWLTDEEQVRERLARPRNPLTGDNEAWLAHVRSEIVASVEALDADQELDGVRVLSTRQPWATALLELGKPVENRTWRTAWTGTVVIHAGQKWDPRGRDLPAEMGVSVAEDAPTGYLGLMDLVGCHRDSGCCRPWGEPGQFHWEFTNPRLFEAPIPAPGRRGLYRRMPAAVARAVRRVLTRTAPADMTVPQVLIDVATVVSAAASQRTRGLERSALTLAASLVSAHAQQALRAIVRGSCELPAITRLEAVVHDISARATCTTDVEYAAALEYAAHLLRVRYTAGFDYRVTVRGRDNDNEVVVRAMSPDQAVTRVTQPLYVITGAAATDDLDVASVDRLTSVGPGR